MNTVDQFLAQTKGKFISVTFARKTSKAGKPAGSLETRVFRTGVTKGVKGEGVKFDREEKGIVTLWCVEGFRHIYKDNIIALKCGGKAYVKT
jgi:hypothetical protein